MKTITRITTVISENSKYAIVKDADNKYHAINHEYITNSRINRELNALQTMISDTLAEVTEKAIRDSKIKVFIKNNPNATEHQKMMFVMSLFA